MCPFAVFNLVNQSSSCLGKVAHTAADEAFPPNMLLLVCALRSLSCANADEHADFSSGPFVAHGFVENLRCGVVFASALVEEDGLADLDGLEC